ncbi:hypothetical protein PIROE2DRAFT_66696 [Piromyces sp. E2]|nr:hypothetical protein PIROE2DRAFT_66696 [Piromyces sp. E2]|eukprot:OUM70692.1 hypothetical protein PIROE2DRAFT_66696 [Piromyces sp. E2]
MTKTENSADLINNLLLNLDNLKIMAENKKAEIEEVSESIKDQLESLKNETEKITSQYTQKNNTKTKTRKIPPPIITGKYHMRSQFQTIDDMLFELNNVSIQAFGGNKTPAPKSGKGRMIPGSFIDPRRYSDPYKYTILSTLDETEDGEEEEEDIPNTPQTPKTALPFYSRKKDYKNISCNVSLTPKSAGCLRNRSYSQPERYSSKKGMISSSLHESSSLNYMKSRTGRTSTEYLNRIKNIVDTEQQKSNSKPKRELVKPPRSSSISKHSIREINKIDEYSSSETSDSDPNTEPVYYQYHAGEMHISKKKGFLGLENKSSFQSDITLVNE